MHKYLIINFILINKRWIIEQTFFQNNYQVSCYKISFKLSLGTSYNKQEEVVVEFFLIF